MEKVCISPTQATSEIQKTLQKENMSQYSPIFKVNLSFKLPKGAKDMTLTIVPKSLAAYGL